MLGSGARLYVTWVRTRVRVCVRVCVGARVRTCVRVMFHVEQLSGGTAAGKVPKKMRFVSYLEKPRRLEKANTPRKGCGENSGCKAAVCAMR